MAISDIMRETALSAIARRSAEIEGEALVLMDEDSFRAFYDRTARAVWVYLSHITGDRQLADDLLQETYYRFYRAGAVHESESHRRNSLYCIATNLARDAHRRRGNVRMVELEENELPPVAGDAERSNDRTDLARAMAHLKPAQREILWLAYGQGFSHAEIAQTLGTKVDSVKQILLRARRKLAGILRGDQP
jgi:RNA polymerase sigma-70 factor (ECF subfamily)